MSQRLSKETREFVRVRANQRCEYCRIPESDTYAPHHVDHITPIVFGGTSDTDNLAWACYLCNSIKSAYIGSYDRPTKTFTPLFHPREDSWHEHFEMITGEIIGKTPIGQVTVFLLRINTTARIEKRKLLMELGEWE